MSVWNRISDATRISMPELSGGSKGGGKERSLNAGAWLVMGAFAVVGWAIWSGWALLVVLQFERNLLALVPPTAVTVVILSVLGTLAGWVMMKFPRWHFMAVWGKRLIWVSPAALVVGATIVPIAIVVVTLTQVGTTRLAASYSGTTPAANLCAAAGLAEATPAPAVSPASAHR